MSNFTIFDYAKQAAQAERRILELLDGSLGDGLAEARHKSDVRKTARARQGSKSSG